MNRPSLALTVIVALASSGCQLLGLGGSDPGPAPPASAQSTANPAPQPESLRTLALVDGKPVFISDLRQALLESQGGVILAELVLDRAVQQRLSDRGMKLTDPIIQAERRLLASSLAQDEDQAERLLIELRERRGLGPQRFEQLLRRNAGLRLLVQDQVQVREADLKDAYEMNYGTKYEARLITVDTVVDASDVVRKAGAGESFIDLAIKHSTDLSRAQGGLLPLISPVDPTFPKAVRVAVARLQPGEVSEPVALETGFAILKLERKIHGPDIQFADVKAELTEQVRVQVERLHMQRLARELLTGVDVVTLDPALQKSWNYQKQQMLEQK